MWSRLRRRPAGRPAVVMVEEEAGWPGEDAAEAGAGRPAVVAVEDETGRPEVVTWLAVVAAEDKAGRSDMDASEHGAGWRTCT